MDPLFKMGKVLVIGVEMQRSGAEVSEFIGRLYPEYMGTEVQIVSSPARALQGHALAALLGRESEENLVWAANSGRALQKAELQALRLGPSRTVVVAEESVVQDLARDFGAEADLANPWVVLELSEGAETAFRRQREVFPVKLSNPVEDSLANPSVPTLAEPLPSDLEAIHLRSRLTTVNALLARCQADLQELDRTGQMYGEEQFLYILTDLQVKDSVVQLRVVNRQERRVEGVALEVRDELGTVTMQVGGIEPGTQTIRFRVKLDLNTVKSLKVVLKRGNSDISNQREITLGVSLVPIEETTAGNRLESTVPHCENPQEDSKEPF